MKKQKTEKSTPWREVFKGINRARTLFRTFRPQMFLSRWLSSFDDRDRYLRN